MRIGRALFSISILLTCCSPPSAREESKIYQAGEQARAGALAYTIADSRIVAGIGNDAATARVPKDRFYIVQISVTDEGATDTAIPALALVDDSGRAWNELSDGSGVADWLVVVRNVKPRQTVEGSVLFDAPAQHYRLRLTAEFEQPEISIDLPLSFVHEQLRLREQITDAPGTTAEPPAAGTGK